METAQKCMHHTRRTLCVSILLSKATKVNARIQYVSLSMVTDRNLRQLKTTTSSLAKMIPKQTFFPDATMSSASGSSEYEIKNAFDGRAPSADSILATALNKLTFHERESVNDEIHGINIERKYIEQSGAVEESPELLSRSLDELQAELDRLCSAEGGFGELAYAFQRSQDLYGSTPEGTYFNTSDFRLMFIRCDRFDCKKAAIRLCKFADLFLEIFGEFALQRPVRFSDLEENEVAMLKNGFSCPFPRRDRAGRRIYCHFAQNYNADMDIRFKMRVTSYPLMHIISHDVDSQRRGFVAVMWMLNLKKPDIHDYMDRGRCQGRLLAALPIKVGAGHYCFQSIRMAKDAAFSHLVHKLVTSILPYVRVHSGTPTELVYTLESFGVSSKQSPIDIETGGVNINVVDRWLKYCIAREENPLRSKQYIDCPNHTDILFGRGQIVMAHPGNSMFRDFIHSNLEQYSNIQSKKESTQWTWSVVRTLKSDYGARFLKEERIDNGLTALVEVSNETARSKVRIAFRDARSRQTKFMAKEKQTSSGPRIRTTKRNGRANQISSAAPSSTPTATSFLAKRTIRDAAIPGDLLPREITSDDDHDISGFGLTFEDFEVGLSSLNNNIAKLNTNLNTILNLQQVANSSTSQFLGLDGSNTSKRQRMDTDTGCFDCV